MKSTKYRFKKEFSDARISIPGQDDITKDNLTDELGDRIFKSHPRVSHNLELVSGAESDKDESEVQKLKAQLSDLKKENKELKAEIKTLRKDAPAEEIQEDKSQTDSQENVNEG